MTIFEDELSDLKVQILKMGSLVEEAIVRSIKSLVERNSALAHQVIENEARINSYDVNIDEECIRLIALRQPTAGDLRFITTAMKITTDLERMGDYAVDICERVLELNEEPQLKPYIDIPRMAEIAEGMVHDALQAFLGKNTALAYEVVNRDDEVDQLTVQIFNELLLFMIKDSSTITRAIKISYISKYLERIADHATNLAEMVVYMIEGKMIRHIKDLED
ncbi:MAG: phosphate signaling complex protein PhoU [Thermodesulfobacteriota bacterium]|jgi:phosphate transport system protein